MLTNIFIALPEEANEILNFYSHTKEWSVLEFNGLDNSAFAGLLVALELAEEANYLEGEEYLLAMEDQGPWVFGLPIIFLSKLSKLSEKSISEVALKWASSKELSFMSVNPTDLIPVIISLKEFSEKALNNSRQLLLWMSL